MQKTPAMAGSPRRTWDTGHARPAEQFAYYREAICQAFMNLTPERPETPSFAARGGTVGLGSGAINRVTFPKHTVRRSAADIACSDRRCFYLNLKLAGQCQIEQDKQIVNLSPGQIGIFDSGREFALHHAGGPLLRVASFWVPADELLSRLPRAFKFTAARVSDDPFIGHLIVETARTLNSVAARMPEEEGARLFMTLIELVAVSLSQRGRPQIAEAKEFSNVVSLALRRAIHDRLREPGLSAANVAFAVGISERYVHKLFEKLGDSFSNYVIGQRLEGAARDLNDPELAQLTIGAIAFNWGFSDLSHFTRRFKQRFGRLPKEWRKR